MRISQLDKRASSGWLASGVLTAMLLLVGCESQANAVCEALCQDCDLCGDQTIEQCKAEVEDLQDFSEDSGCDDALEPYLDCIEMQLDCTIANLPDTCRTQEDQLEECLGAEVILAGEP